VQTQLGVGNTIAGIKAGNHPTQKNLNDFNQRRAAARGSIYGQLLQSHSAAAAAAAAARRGNWTTHHTSAYKRTGRKHVHRVFFWSELLPTASFRLIAATA